MVWIAKKNLFQDKIRFLITVVGVIFSVVLIFAQMGIYLGFMKNASLIIDNIDADIWITAKNIQNFEWAWPIDETKLDQAREVKGVLYAEKFIMTWGVIKLAEGGTEQVEIIGYNPDGKLGTIWKLKQGKTTDVKGGRYIIVDESSFSRLGKLNIGDIREMNLNCKVKVVGISEGIKSFTTAPYILTSHKTAQEINPDLLLSKTAFILVKIDPKYKVNDVLENLKKHVKNVDIYKKADFSFKTRKYWTLTTGMGIGFLLTALMGFIVGMVIVGQTVYSATMEHLREFGTLKAIGATNWQIYRIIFEQAIINACLGFLIGWGLTLLIKKGYDKVGLTIELPSNVIALIFVITLSMCIGASFFSVRKVRTLDPMMVFKA
jgi:putative ABC transport system permease protein